MRYFATLAGEKTAKALELEALPGGHFAITLDGARHEVDRVNLEPGSVSLFVDGEHYAVDVEEAGDLLHVLVRDEVYTVDVADERKLRMRAASHSATAEGKQVLRAPMPGKVVKILVKPGDAVAEGQGTIVVEAMKMENELKSPKAGTVLEVSVKEGQAVDSGAPLATIE